MKYLCAILGGLFVGLGLSLAVQSAAAQPVPQATVKQQVDGPVSMRLNNDGILMALAFGQKANGHVSVVALDPMGRVICAPEPVK